MTIKKETKNRKSNFKSWNRIRARLFNLPVISLGRIILMSVPTNRLYTHIILAKQHCWLVQSLDLTLVLVQLLSDKTRLRFWKQFKVNFKLDGATRLLIKMTSSLQFRGKAIDAEWLTRIVSSIKQLLCSNSVLSKKNCWLKRGIGYVEWQ